MRTAVLGAAIEDLGQLRQLVCASTTITHTDPKAFHGAMAVAVAAGCAVLGQANVFIDRIETSLAGDRAEEMLALL